MRLFASILCLAASGCVTLDQVQGAVRHRASGELRCPPEQLSVMLVEGDPDLAGYEAFGCGWRRSYAARCVVKQLDLECDVSAASPLRPAFESSGR